MLALKVSRLLVRPRSPPLTLVFLPNDGVLACGRSPTSDLCPDDHAEVSGVALWISGSDSVVISLISHFGPSPGGGGGGGLVLKIWSGFPNRLLGGQWGG